MTCLPPGRNLESTLLSALALLVAISDRGRASVEREFGRLKHEWALLPLRVRGIERVQLHADLTMLGRLSLALARARAVPLAA